MILAGLLQGVLPEGRTGSAARLAPHPHDAVFVPGAQVLMGSTAPQIDRAVSLCLEGASDGCPRRLFVHESPAIRVRTRPLLVGTTEVANADYEACVRAGACQPRAGHRPDPRFDAANHPVVDVTHSDANDYCRWRRGRLPTEAEWEHAARGPRGRLFPWGDGWNGALCNHGQSGSPLTDDSDGHRYVAPVGSYPEARSPVGALDMAGNVWEWVADWYAPDSYGLALERARGGVVTDPRGPETGRGRVIRGGSFAYPPFAQRGATRAVADETERALDIGFRCAWDVLREP